VHDSAKLTGATTGAAGTVTYTVYSGATCNGSPVFAPPAVNLSKGVVPDSPAFTPAAAGTFNWLAVYSGDSANGGSSSSCGSEPLTVTALAAPTIATSLSASAVATGTAVHDSAKLTGAATGAGGTVTYTVYGGTTCAGSPVFAPPGVSVVGGVVPNSTDFTSQTPGIYNWLATYSGDSADASATTKCGDETFTVSTATAGDQGCSPEFWGDHPNLWKVYSPDQRVRSVFTGFEPELADLRLARAIDPNDTDASWASSGRHDRDDSDGHGRLMQAERALARSGVAALLNASNSGIDYDLTVAQVTSQVNAALSSRDRDSLSDLAAQLAADNRGAGGCPLQPPKCDDAGHANDRDCDEKHALPRPAIQLPRAPWVGLPSRTMSVWSLA
jgi:hypothetical protein